MTVMKIVAVLEIGIAGIGSESMAVVQTLAALWAMALLNAMAVLETVAVLETTRP